MAGVDPKSVVCEFFRHGQCAKGNKCKYSHDLSVERKGEKIDIYSDQRDGGGEILVISGCCIRVWIRFLILMTICLLCRHHGRVGSGDS